MSLASDLVGQARRTLQDYDIDRHTDPDLLRALNGARRALAIAMPQAYSTETLFTCVAGSRQTLPSDTAVFYEVTRTEAGAPVTIAERELLDTFSPGWRNQTAGPAVHFCYDERDRFLVDLFPPAVAGAKVYISRSQRPVDIALGDSLNPTEELMRDPLVDYTVGRILLEDASAPENERRAMVHFQAFSAATGMNINAVVSASPNVFNTGGKPPRTMPSGGNA